jgi:hypothetical protein
MIVEFPAPPFTRESLTSTFGFPVPLPFVAFLNALCQDCANGEAVRARVADVLEWDLADEDQRYQQTPPEREQVLMGGCGCSKMYSTLEIGGGRPWNMYF